MTDNEIIKALEYCSIDKNCCYCPYFCGNITCMDKRDKDVLNLINRQKAEINKLNKKVEELSEVLSDSIKIRVSDIKTEGIKEFVERLKGNFTEQFCGQKYDLIHGWIDNLVKEMIGEIS